MSWHREKIDQAKALVAQSGIDVWLTFVRESAGSGDPLLPLLVDGGFTWQTALLITRDGRAIAVLGNYDADPLVASGDWDAVVPYIQGIREPLLEVLDDACGPEPRIAVNTSLHDDKADGITHGMYRALEGMFEGTRFEGVLESAENLARALRGRKSGEEAARMREALRETDLLFAEIAAFAKVGVSERAVYDHVHRLAAERGLGFSWDPAGDPIVNSGPHSMVGHGIPSETIVLEPGHIFHVDLGIVKNMYSSDIQRCWYVSGGEPVPDDVVHAQAAVLAAIDAGFNALKPGVAGWEVDAAARAALVAAGYEEYLHALGHQVGLVAHDGGGVLAPRWERYGQTPFHPVEESQVYTLELGVTVPGRGYLGLEEMVVVTPSGCEYLSEPQRTMPVL